MSRSIHKTVMGVFGGQSKAEIGDLVDNDDPDVLELAKKYAFKREAREARAEAAAEPAPPRSDEDP